LRRKKGCGKRRNFSRSI